MLKIQHIFECEATETVLYTEHSWVMDGAA